MVPLALIAGYAIRAIYEMVNDLTGMAFVSWFLAGAILVVSLGVAGYQTVDLNFINYDNDREYVYVYAHTKRHTLNLVNEVDRIAKQNSGGTTGITIESGLLAVAVGTRGFSRVGYGRMAATTEPIIIVNANQKDEVDTNFGHLYQQVPGPDPGGTFELRPA